MASERERISEIAGGEFQEERPRTRKKEMTRKIVGIYAKGGRKTVSLEKSRGVRSKKGFLLDSYIDTL